MEDKGTSEAAHIIYLISRYNDGHIDFAELQELEEWKNSAAKNQRLFDELTDQANIDAAVAKMQGYGTEDKLSELQTLQQRSTAKRRRNIRLYRYAAAAAVLLLVTTVAFYFNRKQQAEPVVVNAANIDVAPGSSKATLTLADGRKINLDDASKGTIAVEAGNRIQKTADGELIYQKDVALSLAGMNTITTPNGGEYKVRLPDGTQVWLNAASSLTYPSAFNATERRVELRGEAYFEVAHNQKQPFIVSTANQQVQVLGTHFNINSYADEGKTVTTLEQGSVKVTSGKWNSTLVPGQQTLLNAKGMETGTADMETALAWKNGRLEFRDADIRTIMRQVSRWYDIEVDYRGEIPNRIFDGSVSRKSNLSALLKILELSEIHFALEKTKDQNGRKKLIVLP